MQENTSMKVDLTFKEINQKLDVEFKDTNQKLDIVLNDGKEKMDILFDNMYLVDNGGIISNNYDKLANKPKIEDVTLVGNKSFEELGLNEMSNQKILEIAKKYLV